MGNKVPARYIGGHTVQLGAYGGPYYDADGKQLSSLLLSPGDTLMVEEAEVRGESYLFDPRGVNPTEFLGCGRIVKPEHMGLSNEELAAIGYRFDAGRSDFQEIVPGSPASGTLGSPAEPSDNYSSQPDNGSSVPSQNVLEASASESGEQSHLSY